MFFIRFTVSKYYTYIVVLIFLFNKVVFIYSHYIKKGIVYIVIIAPSNCKPSFNFKYTKLNIYSSCNIQLISNTKCIFLMCLYSL